MLKPYRSTLHLQAIWTPPFHHGSHRTMCSFPWKYDNLECLEKTRHQTWYINPIKINETTTTAVLAAEARPTIVCILLFFCLFVADSFFLLFNYLFDWNEIGQRSSCQLCLLYMTQFKTDVDTQKLRCFLNKLTGFHCHCILGARTISSNETNYEQRKFINYHPINF